MVLHCVCTKSILLADGEPESKRAYSDRSCWQGKRTRSGNSRDPASMKRKKHRFASVMMSSKPVVETPVLLPRSTAGPTALGRVWDPERGRSTRHLLPALELAIWRRRAAAVVRVSFMGSHGWIEIKWVNGWLWLVVDYSLLVLQNVADTLWDCHCGWLFGSKHLLRRYLEH